MALKYYHDEMLAALKLWAVNHPEWGNTVGDLLVRFYPAFSFTPAAISASDADARDALFDFWRSTLALGAYTVAAGNFREREIEFWTLWRAKPPTPAA